MKKPIQVALVDDHVVSRQGFCKIISNFEGFQIISEHSNTGELMELISGTHKLPDILLICINYSFDIHLISIEHLKAAYPDIKILAISAFGFHYDITRLKQKGINGFLKMDASEKDIRRALLSVHYTGSFNELLRNDMGGAESSSFLSTNEKRLMAYLCEDISYEQVAEMMDMDVNAVKEYRDILFEKLGVTSRVGLLVNSYIMGVKLQQH